MFREFLVSLRRQLEMEEWDEETQMDEETEEWNEDEETEEEI
jgi:hypothetical protein